MSVSHSLLSLYEYYTNGGIKSGLDSSTPYFTLNSKNFTIYSGSVHYFRVPKHYWRDRLKKLRACGLNTVETYIPWNLHEVNNGTFDFGNGGTDMEQFLNITEFLSIAKEEDLFAIVRVGPYIDSEWEFGGLPSWLLKEAGIKLRTSQELFMKYVSRYFNILLPLLALLQFTKSGPIIMFQVENEYGATESEVFEPDKLYLKMLYHLMKSNGIVELLATSDSPILRGDKGTIPEMFLQTANFGSEPEKEFDRLKELQPNRPLMAMEFWSGWYDHWAEIHHQTNRLQFYNLYERILSYPASVSLYMFHGGTSFGFMNGADLDNNKTDNSGFQPDTTSYDYDAPLTENGNYTEKYFYVQQLIKKYNKIKTRLPQLPLLIPTTAYGNVFIKEMMLLDDIIPSLPLFKSNIIKTMESLDQNYGYIIYRKRNLILPKHSALQILGHVHDVVIVMINGFIISKPLLHSEDLNGFGFWRLENSSIILNKKKMVNATLDLIVENWGRNSYGFLSQYNQLKGLFDNTVIINDDIVNGWEIFPLDFNSRWISLIMKRKWKKFKKTKGPALYKAILYVDQIQDTFVNMKDWCKGLIIVNGFVLGKYSKIGPQQTLYLPAPFLKLGRNEILIFEQYKSSDLLKFSPNPIFKTN